ncbi:MAG: phospholipase D-like domain-containing protein [Bdellovibrionia bacterium]
MNPRYWTSVEFYSTGDQYFSAVLDEIRKAQVTVRLETYIFSLDPMTEEILSALEEAQRRGVWIQILVDGFGSFSHLETLRNRCQKSQFQFKVFHPLPSRLKIVQKFLRIFTTRYAFVFKKINRRNHRKQILIDDRIAFVGSLNLTEVHSHRHFGKTAWKDFGVRLEGPPLFLLERAFRNAWNIAESDTFLKKLLRLQFDKTYDPRQALVRLNTSRRMRSRLKKDLVRRIEATTQKIWISTAYFLPRPRLLKAILNASKRGVEVQLLLPGISDAPVVKWASYQVLKKLLVNGVKIFEYQPAVLHSKYLVLDNHFATLGSTNFNHRSFLHDLELEAVFTESAHIRRVEAEFLLEKTFARELNILELKSWPWYLRLTSRIAYRMRYLL